MLFQAATFWGATGGVSATFLGSNTAASGTSIALTTSATAAAGSLIVVAVGCNSSTVQNLSSVADGSSNSYAVDRQGTGGIVRAAVASAANATALSSGGTITATFSGFAVSLSIAAVAISGMAASALDRTSKANGLGTTASSGSTATTTQASEVAIGFAINNGADFTEDASFINLAKYHGSVAYQILAYRLISSTGTYAYAPTLASANWESIICTYKTA